MRTQVLVIGGGPAGSAAARLLADNGFSTLLIDRDFSFVKPCGGGVPVTIFQDTEIPETLGKRMVKKAMIVSPGGEQVEMDLTGKEVGIVQRGEFDQALRSLAKKAGADLLEAEFRRFVSIGKTITADLTVKRPSQAQGEMPLGPRGGIHHERIQVQCDYVLAADGINSRVRSSLGISPLLSFLTLSEKIKTERSDTCEFWFGSGHAPQCYSWVFPQGEGVSVGTGTFTRPGIRELFQNFLERRGVKGVGAARGYKVPLWQGDLYHADRILFIGDAAGQVLPFTFEGIYYAMKSGAMAAAAVVSGKVEDYRRSWEGAFRKEFLLMKRLWKHFMKNDVRAETAVELLKEPRVQDASLRLWIKRDLGRERLLLYLSIMRGFLRWRF